MNLEEAQQKLESIQQQHLLTHFSNLTSAQQRSLLLQVESLDTGLFQQQQKLLLKKATTPSFTPYQDFSRSGNSDDIARGQALLKEGKVGCLLIAGGQASRLQLDAPKGTYPITPIEGKSLFQLFAEKTLAASAFANRPLYLAIMTSPLNHEQTVDFFAKHQNFGLKSSQLDFFRQSMLPLLDTDGNLFLDASDHIAEGPDGNGSALSHFVQSGIYEKWVAKGIEYLNFILVDNPLADPFDFVLTGFHARSKAEIVIKAIERKDPEEKVGVIVRQNEKVSVIEYTELPPDPDLKHPLANISLFSYSMPFVEKAAKLSLPLHLAFKAVKTMEKERPSAPNAWKFERFIFDLLPFSDRVEALVYPREECFAPLKNMTGEGSPESVQNALMQRDRKVYLQVTGSEATEEMIELSQEFYYPTQEFLRNI